MDQLIPSIQSVIASSTSNMVTFASFLFPVIAFTFGVVATVAVIVFVVNLIKNIFLDLFTDYQIGRSKNFEDFSENYLDETGHIRFFRKK